MWLGSVFNMYEKSLQYLSFMFIGAKNKNEAGEWMCYNHIAAWIFCNYKRIKIHHVVL